MTSRLVARARSVAEMDAVDEVVLAGYDLWLEQVAFDEAAGTVRIPLVPFTDRVRLDSGRPSGPPAEVVFGQIEAVEVRDEAEIAFYELDTFGFEPEEGGWLLECLPELEIRLRTSVLDVEVWADGGSGGAPSGA